MSVESAKVFWRRLCHTDKDLIDPIFVEKIKSRDEAIRREEREKCAKIADKMANEDREIFSYVAKAIREGGKG